MKSYSLLIVSAYFPPHTGGVERFTFNIANEICALGHKVTILTSDCGRQTADDCNSQARVIRLRSKSIAGDRFPIILPQAFPQIASLKHESFDAVVVNTRYYPISVVGCGLAKRFDVHPIILDHSSGYLSSDANLIGCLLRIYEHALNRILSHYHPSYYGVSSSSVHWLSHLGFQPRGIIHNAIDPDALISAASAFGDSFANSQDGCPLVVYCGRLVESKGVLKAISAIKRINSSHPRVHLAIAGDGPLADAVSRLQDSTIHYCGLLDRSDIASLLIESDIFLFPSDYPEGLPTVILEAGCCKNAVITSNCGGAVDVIPDESFGLVLKDTSIDSIVNAIESMLNHPDYRRRVACKLEERIKRSFTWRESANNLIQACLAVRSD